MARRTTTQVRCTSCGTEVASTDQAELANHQDHPLAKIEQAQFPSRRAWFNQVLVTTTALWVQQILRGHPRNRYCTCSGGRLWYRRSGVMGPPARCDPQDPNPFDRQDERIDPRGKTDRDVPIITELDSTQIQGGAANQENANDHHDLADHPAGRASCEGRGFLEACDLSLAEQPARGSKHDTYPEEDLSQRIRELRQIKVVG